eukprot:Tamp_28366.p1 GENE.Tamp_28366~~Tamp_28366.p1  ORF type:complete len:213 (+),score=34.57 Tamp_28366:47-640(+)
MGTKGGNVLQMLDETWWLAYCCCTGVGCATCTKPHLCEGNQKLMCLKSNCSGDLIECCGPEGFIMGSQKTCCLYQSVICPPNGGACFGECCGMKVFGQAKGERGLRDDKITDIQNQRPAGVTVTANNFGSTGQGGDEMGDMSHASPISSHAQASARAAILQRIKEALEEEDCDEVYRLALDLPRLGAQLALPDAMKM